GLVVGAQAVDPLDVIVKTDGGSIEGNVVDADRKPAGEGLYVVLIPPRSRRQNSQLYKVEFTDSRGRFTMSPIPPGVYTIFAWDNVRPDAWENAEFMVNYAGRGTSVTVSGNLKTSAEVVLTK